ncbi:MAG TPA: WecB/TagA/CpsF family glycosyltransferase [Acidimicrobiales bacterium]|nr:WecB/TagA/CpsF family glycosyltransferase [Acidimicrobiales bacterium]
MTDLHPHVKLLGVRFDNLSQAEVVGHIVSSAARGEGGWMANPNVDHLRQIAADNRLRELVAGADLVVADGMPVIWASRLAGTPLNERAPASELVLGVCRAAADAGIGVFLLGGPPEAGEKAASILAAKFPGLRVSHMSPPFGFERDSEQMEHVIGALSDKAPQVVFCAFGFPKQERLMQQLLATFPNLWFIACGGTFSIVAGETPKAPEWMSKAGLEWAHRLRLEPGRLWKRYLVHDLPFAIWLITWSGVQGIARRWPAASGRKASLF